MKKNIVIIFLICIIIILLIKIMNPSVVTQRKIVNSNIITAQRISDKTDYNKEEGREKEEQDSEESPLVPEFRLQDDSENRYSESEEYEPTKLRPGILITRKTYEQNKRINEFSNYKITDEKQAPYTLPEECDLCSSHEDSANHRGHNTLKKYDISKNINKSDGRKNNSHGLNGIDTNLPMCTPYKETATSKYMGMNIEYTIEILGWQNGKCVLNFESNISGHGSTFDNKFEIPSGSLQVFGFAPKVRCEFTKQQLLYVGDNILEEHSNNRKMLKDPNQINFPDKKDLSFSDMRLLQVVFNDKACSVLNTEDLSNILEGLFGF